MPRPIVFFLVYLAWATAMFLHGWFGWVGSDCINALVFIQEGLASLKTANLAGAPAYFCWGDSLEGNQFWVALVFFTLLPGVFAFFSLWLRDRLIGIRHIDLQV